MVSPAVSRERAAVGTVFGLTRIAGRRTHQVEGLPQFCVYMCANVAENVEITRRAQIEKLLKTTVCVTLR